MLPPPVIRIRKLSASSNLSEALIKGLMVTVKTPFLSARKSRKKDGTAKLSSLKTRKLISSTKMSSADSAPTSAESTPAPSLTTKNASLIPVGNYQQLAFMA